MPTFISMFVTEQSHLWLWRLCACCSEKDPICFHYTWRHSQTGIWCSVCIRRVGTGVTKYEGNCKDLAASSDRTFSSVCVASVSWTNRDEHHCGFHDHLTLTVPPICKTEKMNTWNNGLVSDLNLITDLCLSQQWIL